MGLPHWRDFRKDERHKILWEVRISWGKPSDSRFPPKTEGCFCCGALWSPILVFPRKILLLNLTVAPLLPMGCFSIWMFFGSDEHGDHLRAPAEFMTLLLVIFVEYLVFSKIPRAQRPLCLLDTIVVRYSEKFEATHIYIYISLSLFTCTWCQG